jgi:hypothetical protein
MKITTRQLTTAAKTLVFHTQAGHSAVTHRIPEAAAGGTLSSVSQIGGCRKRTEIGICIYSIYSTFSGHI